jgi:predicted phosphoribosyltransferase
VSEDLSRKLGLPGHPELAMGAIAAAGVRVLNDDVVSWYRIPRALTEHVAREEQAELERRVSARIAKAGHQSALTREERPPDENPARNRRLTSRAGRCR